MDGEGNSDKWSKKREIWNWEETKRNYVQHSWVSKLDSQRIRGRSQYLAGSYPMTLDHTSSCFVSFQLNLLHSILFYYIIFCTILFYTTIFYTILFYSILFYFIKSCFCLSLLFLFNLVILLIWLHPYIWFGLHFC